MTVRLIVLWMFMGVFAAFGLYTVKYKVQTLKAEVAAAETQLREEKKNLHVLTAEWTYLNRPERLQQLSTKYLDIKPMRGQQMADFMTLPYAHAAQAASDITPAARPTKGVTLASGAFHAH